MRLMAIPLITMLHATPATEFAKILDRAPLKIACDKQKAAFDRWTSPGAAVAPSAQVEAALTALEKVTYPTAADVALIRAEIERDFAAAYVPYIPVAGSACGVMRMQLSRMIIKAGGADPKLRARLGPRLSAVMRKQDYPTLLAAMINAVILENGIDQGLWTAPPGLRQKIRDLRQEGKREADEFSALYDKDFNATDLGTTAPSPEAVRRLDILPSRDRIKTAVVREIDKATSLLAREREFAAELR